ncbi:MAG: hypothetical protein H0T79_05840 [Deltaproteobacteria bacterium]|nr:hypothetical protein [Deltaproteobacteria bacterium]
MKTLFALTIVIAAACGGTKPKPEGAVVNEGSAVPDTCCCKSNPQTSEDGKPAYDMANRMECSTKQGECVDDVQCKATQQPE